MFCGPKSPYTVNNHPRSNRRNESSREAMRRSVENLKANVAALVFGAKNGGTPAPVFMVAIPRLSLWSRFRAFVARFARCPYCKGAGGLDETETQFGCITRECPECAGTGRRSWTSFMGF